jgi:DNA-binding GntR family transcriptional regulator
MAYRGRGDAASAVGPSDPKPGNPPAFAPIHKSGLTEAVYRRLRSEIVAAQLLPGELLTLEELGTRYGVSRTPVREALRRLEAEGLVIFREHRRVQVAPLSPNEIDGTYALRILTEAFAVSLSVRNDAAAVAAQAAVAQERMVSAALAGDADAFHHHHLDFHRAIYAGSRSSELIRITEELRTRSDRHRHAHESFHPQNLQATAENHRLILDACQAGDPTSAARLVIEHLHSTAAGLLAQAGVERSALLDAAYDAALNGLAPTPGREDGH